MTNEAEPASLRTVLRYLSLVPGSPGDAIRIYRGFISAAAVLLFDRSRFNTVGFFIHSSRPLRASTKDFSFFFRPGTEDLSIMLQTNEAAVAEWFRPIPGRLMVDVGAHLGSYTLRAAAAGMTVVALEPNPSSFQLLERNVALNRFPNVQTVLSAAGATSTGDLFLEPNPVMTGSTSISTLPTAGRSLVRVQQCTLDSLPSIRSASRVAWMKVDVEGYELEVLKGATETLRKTDRVLIEVWDRNERECRELLVDRAHFRIVKTFRQPGMSYWLLEALSSSSHGE